MVDNHNSYCEDRVTGELIPRKSRKAVADVMRKVVEEINFLREAGQREYAHKEDNAFANFERVADHLSIDRKKVLLTYMLKHVDGVVAYVNGHKSQREDVRGRINDIIVYGIILRAMIEYEESLPQQPE